MFFPKIISKPGLKIASIIDLLFSRRIRTCPLWREPNLRAADQSREHPSIRAGEIQLFPSSSPTSSARPRSRRSLTFYARVSPLWFLTAPHLVLLPLLWSVSGGIGILELVHLFPNASGSPRSLSFDTSLDFHFRFGSGTTFALPEATQATNASPLRIDTTFPCLYSPCRP